MEKKVIESIKNSIPGFFGVIKNQKQQYFSVDYDRKADVLYIAFDDNKKADDTEVYSDEILLRKKNNSLIGVTILHASSFLNQN